MKEELSAHEEAQTWTITPRPDDANVIGCRWILKKKHRPNGSIERYKARLVAK
ncbi:hypothetical protein GOP47_0023665, partial [Adiantum capillus-veneris]